MNWFWMNRETMSYSLNKLYANEGVTKQAFHIWRNKWSSDAEEFGQLIPIIGQIREDHPAMSARKMYLMIEPESMGRDKFQLYCREAGLNCLAAKNPRRTTDSRGVTRFANHIKALNVTRANQVWVSDITYFQMGARVYYITFIMDLFSRCIVGFSVSTNLRTANTTIPALKMPLNGKDFPGLILHTDGGGQYYSYQFTAMTEKAGIINSMTNGNGENNHAERINRTIKNDYLSWYKPTNFQSLETQTKRAVKNYNNAKPHNSLNNRTPLSAYVGAGGVELCF